MKKQGSCNLEDVPFLGSEILFDEEGNFKVRLLVGNVCV